MKTLTLREAKESLRIDRNNLDEEIIKQGELFYAVSEQLVKAKAEKDTEKDNLERIEAELSKHYRTSLKGDKKPTESQIREEVINDRKYEKQKGIYLEAMSEASEWEAMKEAFSQRSFMLRELVNLWMSNYFGDPTVSGNKNIEEIENKSNRRRLTESRSSNLKRKLRR